MYLNAEQGSRNATQKIQTQDYSNVSANLLKKQYSR
jgi:hypothetical protein